MANEGNLRPMGSGARSKSEERAAQSKGGKNSGASRRRKKAMKAAAKMLMDTKVPSQTAKRLEQLGIDSEDATYQMAILVAMTQEAMNGSVGAATFLRDTMGEGPAEEQRRAEARQRKKESEERLALEREEFEYRKRLEQGEQEEGGNLSEAIVDAYKKRMEGAEGENE